MKRGASRESVPTAGRGNFKPSSVTIKIPGRGLISLRDTSPAKRRNQHVVPLNGRWAVRREGTTKATIVLDEKSEAIDVARNLARRQGTDLIIHGLSGQIFQRSEVKSTIGEKKIRDVIRTSAIESASKKPTKKKSTRKSTAKSMKK